MRKTFIWAGVLLLAGLLVAAGIAWAYLWWKTRGLRRQVWEQRGNSGRGRATAARDVFRGEVIEGEAIRVDTKRDMP